jgi:hypothetical protein
MSDLADRLTGRKATGLLLVAGAISTALILYLNRGTTFYLDEMVWFGSVSRGFDAESILAPHNAHLIGTSRVFYALVSELAGPDYVIFRIAAVVAVLACSALLYAWARRRVGDVWALLPATLILYFGSAWQHIVGPIGFTITVSIAFGLAALLALEREDRRSDVLACVFASLAVFTYTIGIAFLVGVAIAVLLRRDRFLRAWIFLIPLALYAAWWIWAQQFDQARTTIANVGHVAGFFADSLAVGGGAISGLAIPFSRFGDPAPIGTAPPGPLGWIVAVLLVVAVAWRLYRGGYSPTIFASLGILGTYWLAAALSDPLLLGEQADAVRYVLPGSVGILLVLTDASNGLRPRGGWAVTLLAIFAFSLVMNIVFLRDGAAYLREQSARAKARLAMLELANGWVPGDGPVGGEGSPRYQLAGVIPFLGYGPDREEYLAAVADHGSPADDLDEIRGQPDSERAVADDALRQAYALGLNPTTAPRGNTEACTNLAATDGPFQASAGGFYVRPLGREPVAMAASRFGPAPGFSLGAALPDRWSWVLIPTDPAPEPWYATLTSGKAKICPVPTPP